MKILDYILARLGENSTWRGLILLATASGIAVEPDKAAAITALGMALVGVINVFRSSK